jgi:hypothetical protein
MGSSGPKGNVMLVSMKLKAAGTLQQHFNETKRLTTTDWMIFVTYFSVIRYIT